MEATEDLKEEVTSEVIEVGGLVFVTFAVKV